MRHLGVQLNNSMSTEDHSGAVEKAEGFKNEGNVMYHDRKFRKVVGVVS